MMTGPYFGAVLNATTLLFGVFGLVLVYLARDIDHWPTSLSVATLLSTIVHSAFALLDPVFANGNATQEALLIFRNAEVIIAPLPFMLIFAYFLYCCGEDYKKSLIMRVQIVLTCVIVLAEFLAQLTGEVNSAPNTEAHLGPWLILALALTITAAATCLFAFFRRWKKLPGLQRALFLAMFLLLFLSTSSIGIVVEEILLMSDLVRRYLAQEEMAAQQQARIAVLQMRPHFIHNTLTSIYYLCAKDPKKAQQTILDFSRYLQKNFTGIVEEGTVPFTEELEHTRAYLAVEQACHEGHLLVEFNTPVTFFRIPPLTLQPIVENAVKHGLDPDSGPLRVSVATRDTGPGVEVVVTDNGPGFTPPEDGRLGFALDNIRERLKTQCDGTLSVQSKEGDGTLVTVSIPWK
ncbi:MAG: histidine kinase [Atopobiaceae bacterium]|nr:histidine kinase [Atopobiaceae bacterium]